VIASIGREYLEVIDRIQYSEFGSKEELRYLESQRVLLHQQLRELLGYEPTVEQVRSIVLDAQARGEY
jgi:hypothetical protein